MKQLKKLTALLLAFLLTVSTLVLPAGAAGTVTTFSDLPDSDTAVAVETLRLMGVLDGYTDGTFRPGSSLTRAQFCKMAVYALNADSQLGVYRATTIFPDVKPAYWASAHINLCAKGKKIIAGFADGYFRPNNIVTYGQAVTILMRVLGYTDADMGTVWPDGYLAQADTIGLTEGVSLTGSSALSRADAAKLFANLLRMNQKDGASYAGTIATTVANVVLVSCAATASDGSSGAMQTSDGTTYKMANKQGSGLLNGRKGTLLLNKAGKALTFVPDAGGSAKTIVLAAARADSLTDTTGRKYTVGSAVQMYYNGESTTYGAVYSLLTPGMSMTLYLGTSGSVEYVFTGGTASVAAVIVAEKGSTTGFAELAGGASNYTIYKDGVKATSADLRQYDVATWDGASNAIRVSDMRISGYYENCSPNASAPTTVTVLGHAFNVLPTAVESLSKLKLGAQITLLLTADNQVAGAIPAQGNTATGNAVGLVTELSASSATVQLLSGITVKGDPSLSAEQVGSLTGQLVTVSSSSSGKLNLSKLTGGSNSDLDTATRKLGSRDLAENVIVYEKVNTSALKAIALSDITSSRVSAAKITYVGINWAGQVRILILDDVTGNSYTYGRANYTPPVSGGDEWSYTNAQVSVTYGNSQTTKTYESGYACADGEYVGIVPSADESRLAGLVKLTKITGVVNSAWSGTSAVTAEGKTYAVSSGVVCYNRSSNSWLTLAAARGFASAATIYVDAHNVVRAVEVSQ